VALGSRYSPFAVFIALLAVVTAGLVVYPIGLMTLRVIQAGSEGWAKLFAEFWFGRMAVDTTIVVVATAVISVSLAGFLAWINERTDAGIGAIGDALPLLPLLLPTVATAMGWVLLAIPEVGFLNGLLDGVGIGWDLNIYSLSGLIFVFVLVTVPYAYLPILAAFRTLDPSLEEAARISGARPLKVFLTVSVRAILPAMLAGLVLVGAVSLSLYSVPVIIATRPGIEMLSVRIVSAIRGRFPPAYDIAGMLSILLALILLGLWLLQRRSLAGGRFATVGTRGAGGSVARLGRWKWPFRSMILLYITFSAVLPIAALVLVSLQTFWSGEIIGEWTWNNYAAVFGRSLGLNAVRNSAFHAIVTGGLTVLVAAAVMVYAHRRRSMVGKFAQGIVLVPAAITNTVFGVAFILAFAGPPFSLGGTSLILGMAFFVVYLPYASIATEVSVASVDRSLEEASSLSGASEGRTFRRILIPLILPGVFAAWALVLVRIVGDLSLAVMLATPNTAVVGFLLIDVWEAGSFGVVAALSLIMTAMTVPVVMLMLWLGRPRWKRKAESRVRTPRPASVEKV
jgi:iron(III) transport system permease protein